MYLLVSGGAGYIGSHFVRLAQIYDHKVPVLDNFSTGNIWAIKDCEVLEVDLLDKKKLSKSLSGRSFDGVIHFAAKSLVGESFQKPNIYYENNITGTLNLVSEMLENNNNNLVKKLYLTNINYKYKTFGILSALFLAIHSIFNGIKFDIKINGEQAIFVKTFLNLKKCFFIVFLIIFKKAFLIELS